jgi:hypothetical protein
VLIGSSRRPVSGRRNGSSRGPAARAQRIVTADAYGPSRKTIGSLLRPPPPQRNGSSRRRPIATPDRAGKRDESSHALVSGCGSALARRVPLRGGRNARPVSSGPSGPTRGQGGAPAGRPPLSGPSQVAGAGGRGRTTLTPASVGSGGIPAG